MIINKGYDKTVYVNENHVKTMEWKVFRIEPETQYDLFENEYIHRTGTYEKIVITMIDGEQIECRNIIDFGTMAICDDYLEDFATIREPEIQIDRTQRWG